MSLSSRFTAEFWTSLMSEKLNKMKLSEEPIEFYGYSTILPSSSTSKSIASVSGVVDFFNDGDAGIGQGAAPESASASAAAKGGGALVVANERIHMRAQLTLLNTLESFKGLDKNSFVAQGADEFDAKVLCFADLKKHSVMYWCAFPAAAGVVVGDGTVRAYKYASLPGRDDGACFAQPPAPPKALDDSYTRLRCRVAGVPPKFFALPRGFANLQEMCSLEEFIEEGRKASDATVFGFLNCSECPIDGSGGRGWLMRRLLSNIQMGVKFEGSPDVVTVFSYRPLGGLRRLRFNEDDSSYVYEDFSSVGRESDLAAAAAVAADTTTSCVIGVDVRDWREAKTVVVS